MRSSRLSPARLVFAAVSLLVGWALLDPTSAVVPSSRATSAIPARFTRVDAGRPVVWRTCASIKVLVNPGPGGAAAFAEIRAAFDEVSAPSGLRFQLQRDDTLIPHANWAVSEEATRLGSPAPVLVGWVNPASTDLLREGVAGAAVANPLRRNGQRHLVTGAIALDATQYDEFAPRAGAGKTRRNLLLHEIGHLLGLDHVEDRAALMYTVVGDNSPDGLTDGETALLAEHRPDCR
jgi:hypothetical protein